MPTRDPCLLPAARPVRFGDSTLDRYLGFVASRARPNTVLAAASDLKLFFGAVNKSPAEVTTADVLDFIAAQRRPSRGARIVRAQMGRPGWRCQQSSGVWHRCRACSAIW